MKPIPLLKAERIACFCLAVLLCVFTRTSAQVVPPGARDLPAGIDTYITKVMDTFDVPGLSIAVVHRDSTLLAKGYGVRSLNAPERVDAQTLFPIASNSKAFTGAALAVLVEQGKIGWQDPVINHLPWFRLSDPYVTAELTIEDLLVHRSGIAPYAGDLLQFPPTTYTRKEVAMRLRHLPLATSFRSTYAYDNVLYLVAGLLIEEVSGMDWESFVQNMLFRPLQMDASISRFSELRNKPNTAQSHAPVNGKVRQLAGFFEQGLGDISNPAGGIASNAEDMAKWLKFHLDSGRNAAGHSLLSAASTAQLWKGVTPMQVPRAPEWLAPAQQDLSSYGLGFRIYTYRWHKAVTHGGKLDGFVSYVLMIPGLDLGIAVLTNQESSNAYHAIINHLVDHFIGAPPFDWIAGYRRSEDLKFERIARIEQEQVAGRHTTVGPSLQMDDYLGRYQDDWYGFIRIYNEDGKYRMRFEHSPLLVGTLSHWQYDTFMVKWDSEDLRADAFVTFNLGPDGTISAVSMRAVSPITDVSYDFHDLNIRPVRD